MSSAAGSSSTSFRARLVRAARVNARKGFLIGPTLQNQCVRLTKRAFYNGLFLAAASNLTQY